MSQCGNIYAYLADGGTLTPLDAFTRFGTLALHSRVAELRERGIPIKCELIEVNGKRVGRYSLDSTSSGQTSHASVSPTCDSDNWSAVPGQAIAHKLGRDRPERRLPNTPQGATRSCESINGTAPLAAARPAPALFEAAP